MKPAAMRAARRAGQVAVRRAVVLGDGDAHAAQAVGPLGHVESSGVPLGVRRAGEGGVAEVESQSEEQAHRATFGGASERGTRCLLIRSLIALRTIPSTLAPGRVAAPAGSA